MVFRSCLPGYQSVSIVTCRALAAAAPVHRAAGFQAACPPSAHIAGGATAAVARLTVSAISSGGLSERRAGEPIHEATDLLLEVSCHTTPPPQMSMACNGSSLTHYVLPCCVKSDSSSSMNWQAGYIQARP